MVSSKGPIGDFKESGKEKVRSIRRRDPPLHQEIKGKWKWQREKMRK